jgi:lysophospholipase L1-like esterase
MTPARWSAIILSMTAWACRTSSHTRSATATAPAADSTPFEPEIRAFEAADHTSPPPLGGVVFVGSSSIKNWTNMATDFPTVPILNRGFGGSTLADVVHYVDRVVLPYHPRLVVLYAGDNDLPLGHTADQVLAEYRAFVARVRSAQPDVRIVFVSIKPSPSRRAYLDVAREANRRIEGDIAGDSLASYVDVFTPMLGPTGQPRPELFLADSLHMTRAGYLLWRRLLMPKVASWALTRETVGALTLPPTVRDLASDELEYDEADYLRGIQVDLNGDDSQDYVIQSAPSLCGNGGCVYLVMDGRAKKVIGQLLGEPLYVLAAGSEEFPDLASYAHLSATTGTYTTWRFANGRYRKSSSRSFDGASLDSLVWSLSFIPFWRKQATSP